MRMKKWLAGIPFFLVMALGLNAQTVDSIQFMTENYPPYNWENDKGQVEGIAVDLLHKMFQITESSQTVKDIKVLPWARGYKLVQTKPDTCLFSMTHTAERDPLFDWVGPIISTRISVFALKSKGLKINTVDDLKKLRAGVIRDDVGDSLAQQAGLQKIDRVNSNDQNIKKLKADRIDIWIYDESVAKWQLKSAGYPSDEFEVVYVLQEGDLSYAFHKGTDQAVLAKLQAALDQLKADGSYEAVCNKYLK